MDFRNEAVTASRRLLEGSSDSVPPDAAHSLCLPVPGGVRLLKTYAIAQLAAIVGLLVCMGFSLLLMKYHFGLGALVGLGAFTGMLVFRKLFSLWLVSHLSMRPGSLCPRFGQRAIPVSIEDAETVQTTKIVTEDEAICLLDTEGKRLLIEGCAYRYVICAKDVETIEVVSGYALSGVKVHFRVGDVALALALCLAGQGPVQSIVQAFAPRVEARNMLTEIRDVLSLKEDRSETGEPRA